MEPTLSEHAEAMLARRGVPRDMVEQVAAAPGQIVAGHSGRKIYQSLVTLEGRQLLLRLAVDDLSSPATVVTVYLTTKIGKYWRSQ